MVNTVYLFSFVEAPRKFIIAELSIRKLGSSSVLVIIRRRRSELTDRKLCYNKFMCCFHKAKQVKSKELSERVKYLFVKKNIRQLFAFSDTVSKIACHPSCHDRDDILYFCYVIAHL